MPGESLLALKENGVGDTKQIVGTSAPTPYLHNIPVELIERFNQQIVCIVNLLCQPGERDIDMPGLDPKMIGKAVWSCYEEKPVLFMGHTLYDMGAYSEPAMCHKIASKLSQPQQVILQPGKSKLGMRLMLHKFLPKTNCRKSGKRTCLAFAIELAKGKSCLEECPILNQPEFAANRQALTKLLE